MNFTAPHFRTDVHTGQMVIVAPLRSLRPSAFPSDPPLNQLLDPFAEGQEHETPGERFAIRSPETPPNGSGWTLRVVPNRYPAVTSPLGQNTAENCECDHSMFPTQPALGEHEVVIECPDSRSRMVELSEREIQQMLVAWQARIRELMQSPLTCSIAVFRNEGFSAGASLAHCHSQILATTELMPLDIERHDRAASHRSRTGHDLVQDLWNAERIQNIRVIRESLNFGVGCPFASRVPWQIRFVPIQGQPASFTEASDLVFGELAGILKSALIALEKTLGGPFSFNLTLTHPRIDRPAEFSWYLDVLPRTGRTAGWELLTNVDIVTVAPEDAADSIRENW